MSLNSPKKSNMIVFIKHTEIRNQREAVLVDWRPRNDPNIEVQGKGMLIIRKELIKCNSHLIIETNRVD